MSTSIGARTVGLSSWVRAPRATRVAAGRDPHDSHYLPTANDEASAVAWYSRDELPGLDIHQSPRRQLGHWLNGTYPHFD